MVVSWRLHQDDRARLSNKWILPSPENSQESLELLFLKPKPDICFLTT